MVLVRKLKITDNCKEERKNRWIFIYMCLSSCDHTECSFLYINFYVIFYPEPLLSLLHIFQSMNWIVLYYCIEVVFFPVFHVVLGIHWGVLRATTGLGRSKNWEGSYWINWAQGSPWDFQTAAPHLTNFCIGLLYKILLEEGFPSISKFEINYWWAITYLTIFHLLHMQFF